MIPVELPIAKQLDHGLRPIMTGKICSGECGSVIADIYLVVKDDNRAIYILCPDCASLLLVAYAYNA